MTCILLVTLFSLLLVQETHAAIRHVLQEDQMLSCGHSAHWGRACRWELRMKNDSILLTWLATKVVPLYIVLSGIMVSELLLTPGIEENWDDDHILQLLGY